MGWSSIIVDLCFDLVGFIWERPDFCSSAVAVGSRTLHLMMLSIFVVLPPMEWFCMSLLEKVNLLLFWHCQWHFCFATAGLLPFDLFYLMFCSTCYNLVCYAKKALCCFLFVFSPFSQLQPMPIWLIWIFHCNTWFILKTCLCLVSEKCALSIFMVPATVFTCM